MTSARTTFFSYLGRHKLKLLSGMLAVGIGSFIAVIPPRLIGSIVDELNRGADFRAVVGLALGLIALSAVENLIRGYGRYHIIDTSRRVEYVMRGDLLERLQQLDHAYFQRQRIGDLMARLTNDLTAVRQMMGFGILMLTSTSLVLFFTVISMLNVSVKLTILSLLLMPLASISFWFIGRRVSRRFEQLQAKFGDLSTKAQENFSGIRVVKAFSQEGPEIDSFAKVNGEYVDRALDLARMNGLIWPAMAFILGMAVLVTLYVGGQDAIAHQLTIGQLIEFVAYLYLLSWPMIALGEVTNLFQQGWASLGRLQEIFNARASISDPVDLVDLVDPASTPIRGEVEFRDVSFSYDGSAVLRNVSFTVPAGGSLAVVGPTGAGKSTLVNLVPRLFDPDAGEVLIDGVPVRRYGLRQLRRAIGYVPQETFLFSVPLRENVGFGADAQLTDSELEWAGDVSQLNKDVEDFPARYDTMIGERGVTLSGG